MIRQNKSEQQHYHSRDDFDHISSDSSWYIQLQNQSDSISSLNMSKKTNFKSPFELIFHDHHRRRRSSLTFICLFAVVILILLLFFISFSIFFPIQQKHDQISFRHHRLKRQIVSSNSSPNDTRHYKNMLRQLLLHRNSSSLPADCTINIPSEGIYHLPSVDTLASKLILLVQKAFDKELQALNRTAQKIRTNITQTGNYLGDFALSKFRDDFSVNLRVLLANQPPMKEIQVMIAPSALNENNGGKYIYYDTIKYFRSNSNSPSKTQVDYDSIQHVILKQNVNIILQTFTAANAYETLKQTAQKNQQQQQQLMNNGWWLGPVLCEINRNETFLMAYIFPLTDSYFLVFYFNISNVDIDQCDNSASPFAGTHQCPMGMECLHRAGQGFTLGAYTCRCSNSDELVNTTINGNDLEWNDKSDDGSFVSTINSCECNPESCRIRYNRFLRTIVVVIQSIFIVFVAILAAIIFQRRKTKIIKHSMWILLELVLLGAALLYASVIVDSFGPHGIVCLIMPWLRELGFTIVYGTLILRIYKMLAEFQSRKAHCVQVKEKDMLRILFFMTISIIGYLLGWTLVNIDHSNENVSLGKYLLGRGITEKERSFFQTCRPRSWDYLVQFAEFVFLCVGVRFIYSTRTAPCEYHERKLITIAIVCEMLFSTLLHIIRDCLWATVHPDGLFILSVFRCHFTVTSMLALIFCTKLCYIFRPFNEEYAGRDRFRSLPDGVEPADLMTKLQSNGDVEFGELNIRDMDPEEIRTELKRLYTSLHVLKTKTMRKDNPHLTKRHGQRRKNRRFSMQAFQRHAGGNPPSTTAATTTSGHMSHVVIGGDKHDHEPTKTPEDSTGSHNEHTHLAGMSIHRGSLDESDDAHGRTLSDLTMTMASSGGAGQRVTFK